MQIKTEGEAIQLAIKTVMKLAPPAEGSVTLRLRKKRAFLLSYSELNSCTVEVPGSIDGEGEFAIGLESLRDATRGRSTVELTYKNTLLYIKSGAYRAELATQDVLDQDEQTLAEGEPKRIGAAEAAWLRTAVTDVALRPTALISTYMPIGIQLTDKGAFVACFDNDRMAFTRDKSIKGDAEFVVPVETLQAVLESVGMGAFDLLVTDAFAEVRTDTVKARMALPSIEDNAVSMDAVRKKAREVAKIEGDILSVSKEKLVAFLDNSKAVALKERGEVKAESNDGKLRLQVKTNAGKIQASVATESGNEVRFVIDFEFLDELVRKSGSEISLRIVGDDFLVGTTAKGVTVLLSFNQEDSSNE